MSKGSKVRPTNKKRFQSNFSDIDWSVKSENFTNEMHADHEKDHRSFDKQLINNIITLINSTPSLDSKYYECLGYGSFSNEELFQRIIIMMTVIRGRMDELHDV